MLAIVTMLSSSIWLAYSVPANPRLLDPKTIPKYVNQLVANIPVYTPTNVTDINNNVIRQDYTVDMVQLREQILPTGTPLVGGVGDGKTTVWGYASN